MKFCFRRSGGHGTEAWQTAYIAEYLNWYFYDTPMSAAAEALLNTDPFAADVIDGQDGWERNYGGLRAVAPWLDSGPNPVPVMESRAEGQGDASPSQGAVPRPKAKKRRRAPPPRNRRRRRPGPKRRRLRSPQILPIPHPGQKGPARWWRRRWASWSWAARSSPPY